MVVCGTGWAGVRVIAHQAADYALERCENQRGNNMSFGPITVIAEQKEGPRLFDR